MLRTIRFALGAAAVLFGGALLAQPKSDTYFPTKLKTTWTYKVGDNLVEFLTLPAYELLV